MIRLKFEYFSNFEKINQQNFQFDHYMSLFKLRYGHLLLRFME